MTPARPQVADSPAVNAVKTRPAVRGVKAANNFLHFLVRRSGSRPDVFAVRFSLAAPMTGGVADGSVQSCMIMRGTV